MNHHGKRQSRSYAGHEFTEPQDIRIAIRQYGRRNVHSSKEKKEWVPERRGQTSSRKVVRRVYRETAALPPEQGDHVLRCDQKVHVCDEEPFGRGKASPKISTRSLTSSRSSSSPRSSNTHTSKNTILYLAVHHTMKEFYVSY